MSGPRIGEQQVGRLGGDEVAEDIELHRLARVVHLRVAHVRSGLDRERAETAVDDALRACDATGIRHATLVELLIDTRVELRLAGADVGERGARRARAVNRISAAADGLARNARIRHDRDGAGWPGQGIGVEVAARHPVRPSIVGRLCHRRVAAEYPASSLAGGRSRIAAETAGGQRCAGSLRLPWRLGDDVDGARQGIGAPDGGSRPANHLDLLDVARVRRDEIPQHQAEEVEIDRTSIEQYELGVAERGSGLAIRDVDVARRELHGVDARHRP